MKLTITLAAILLSTTTAFAGGLAGPIVEAPATPTAYSGNTLYLNCTGAPKRSGSVPAASFRNLPGYSGTVFFVLNGYADQVTAANAIELPAGVHPYDEQDISNYFDGLGMDVVLVTRDDTDRRIETEEVTVVAERGVSDGSAHNRDNLTSMGEAVSDGATIMRVRSSVPQNVSIYKYGSAPVTLAVEPGDTFVEVPGGGTYVAKFWGTHTVKVKATGHQAFNDVSTEQVDVVVRTTSAGEWCS